MRLDAVPAGTTLGMSESQPTDRASSPGPDLEALRERAAHGRAAISAEEAMDVLGAWNLRKIRGLRPLARGSRHSPKLVVLTDGEAYLLKRRAAHRSRMDRIAFSHVVQKSLERRGYPVAGLIEDRHGRTLVEHERGIFELFRFVRGRHGERSREASPIAGALMAEMHERLRSAGLPSPAGLTGSYHGAGAVRQALEQAADMAQAVEKKRIEGLRPCCGWLAQAYIDAATRVERLGVSHLPRRVLHGDWHPGNLMWRDGKVVAVLDFDAIRIGPRVFDLANGALQFAVTMRGDEPPERWPDGMEVEWTQAFVRGYESAVPSRLEPGERQAIPWLMIEALIHESALPIAQTGRFGPLPGASFLMMIQRKVGWIRSRVRRLTAYLHEGAEG